MTATWLAVELLQRMDDTLWLQTLQQVSERAGVPLVAAGDVHMHVRSRKALQDVMTAVREGRPVSECGLALQSSAERTLRSRVKLGALYPRELLDNTLVIAGHCEFSLESIQVPVPDGDRAERNDAGAGAAAIHHRRGTPALSQPAFHGACGGNSCTNCG